MTKKHPGKNTRVAGEQYANIMEEIKRRDRAIRDALNGFLPPQPRIIVHEFCYLQLRFICELIALGCSVVHGDLRNNNKKLNKEWRAGNLIKELERLHPDFYPRPTKQVLDAYGKVERTENIKDGFLSKQELIKVYGKISEHLHRGNVEKIISGNHDKADFSEIIKIATSIINLLGHHQIQMVDSDFQIWTVMRSSKDGNVQVSLLKKVNG